MKYTVDNIPFLGSIHLDGFEVKQVLSFDTETREIEFAPMVINGKGILCKTDDGVDFLSVKFTPIDESECSFVSRCGKHEIVF